MNQILYVQEKQNNHSLNTKKIVLFFAICIILFGVVLLGEGIYYIYQNKINEKVVPQPSDGNTNTQIPPPNIVLTQTEDNKLIMNIQSTVAISHLIYSWNNESAQTIEETGKTTIEEIIDIPIGENVLNLSVIDSNGNETKESKSFVIDLTKPVIGLDKVGNNIKISVVSETELSYITYRWNLEEEKREDMSTYEDKKNFEKIIGIPKGQNTLKIIAVDINQNESEKSQEIKGVTRAKTNVVKVDNCLEFTVVGEENIKTVEFTFNGKTYVMNTDTFGETNTVHYKVQMVEGMNYLKIVSTTQSDAVDTTTWKYEYKAQ